jgi:rhodanese-related sulfurtransferase/C1A family cysteine protease
LSSRDIFKSISLFLIMTLVFSYSAIFLTPVSASEDFANFLKVGREGAYAFPPNSPTFGFVNVSVSDAKNMIDSVEDLAVIDVRNNEEYSKGHIENAILVPLSIIEDRIDELDKLEEILIYCQSGKRSTVASRIFVENGFINIYNMLGGIKAWEDAGYPLTTIAEEKGEAIDSSTCTTCGGKGTSILTNGKGEENLCAVMEYVPPMPDPAGAAAKPQISDTPYEFNWRNYEGGDWTSPVKNQGGCGSCWDFAALGALEAVINIENDAPTLDLDLSEQYVLSCLPLAGDCGGGHSWKAFKYIISEEADGNYVNGIIPESCFPYQADDTVPCSDKCPDWESQLIPVSDYGYWYPNLPSDRDAIKTQLIEKGPLVTYLYATADFKTWGWAHHDPDDYYPYPGPVGAINHAVVIVGYKDDPTIDNGGYWIVKNSWGTGFGYDGFYNVEYDSLHHGELITYVEYVPDSKLNTVVDFSFTPNPVGPGVTCTLSGTLKTTGGSAVYPASVTVDYSTNGGATWNYAFTLGTNAAGAFSASFTAPAAGTYLVRGSYAGSATYNPSSHTETLLVGTTKVDTVLYFSFDPNPVGPGETVQLQGTLKDAYATPVYPAQVTVEYSTDGGATWYYAFTLGTNAAGQFSTSFTAPGEGTYLVKGSYAGSATYNPSSHTETLTVGLAVWGDYHFRISPFIDVIHIKISGDVIYGVHEIPGLYSETPLLGYIEGSTFYILVDYPDGVYSQESMLLVGSTSTLSGSFYQTSDGTSWSGPTSFSLVSTSSASASSAKESALASDAKPEAWPPTYHFQLSPWIDIVRLGVDGSVIHGTDEAAGYYYDQPVLGYVSGSFFILGIDFTAGEGYELVLIRASTSTMTGYVYRTTNGKSYDSGPTVTFVSVPP